MCLNLSIGVGLLLSKELFQSWLIVYKTTNNVGQSQYLNSDHYSQTDHYSARSSVCLSKVIPTARTVPDERGFQLLDLEFGTLTLYWFILRSVQLLVSFRSQLKICHS